MDISMEDEANVKDLLAEYDCHVDSATEMMDEVVSILSEYLEIITVLFAMIFLVTITIFFTVIRTDIEKRRSELYLYHVFGASYRNSRRIVYREYILLSVISSLAVSLSVSILGELFFWNALGIHYAASIGITIFTVMFSLAFIMGCCSCAFHRVRKNVGLEVIRDE